jgi:hypothetical protein
LIYQALFTGRHQAGATFLLRNFYETGNLKQIGLAMDDSGTSNAVSTEGLACLSAESYVRYTSDDEMNKRINQAEPLASLDEC